MQSSTTIFAQFSHVSLWFLYLQGYRDFSIRTVLQNYHFRNYDSVYFHQIEDLIIAFESKQEKETLRAAALGKFYEDYQPSNWGLLYEFIRITNDSEPVNEATDDSRVIDCGLSRKAKPTTLQTFFKSIDITEKHRILITILGL